MALHQGGGWMVAVVLVAFLVGCSKPVAAPAVERPKLPPPSTAAVGCQEALPPPLLARIVEAPSAGLPAPSEPPATREAMLVDATVAGRQVRLRWIDEGGHRPGQVRLTVDDQVVLPADCAPGSWGGLCTRAHRKLRSWEGKGPHLVLVEAHQDDDERIDLFFAATTYGSPECGAYGYFLIRVDASGVRVSNPIVGCLVTPHPASASDGPLPAVAWTQPTVVRVPNVVYHGFRIFVLDESRLQWRQLLEAKP